MTILRTATEWDKTVMAMRGVDMRLAEWNVEMAKAPTKERKAECLFNIRNYQDIKRSYSYDLLRSSY